MSVPPKPPAIQPTPQSEIDGMIAKLRANADRFAKLSVGDYLDLLEKIRVGVVAVAEDMAKAACGAKGVDWDNPESGEEWLAGPMTLLRNVRLSSLTLKHIEKQGIAPTLKHRILPNGQRAVQVYPYDFKDSLLFQGFTAEVWLEPGEEKGALSDHMAEHFRNPPEKGHLSLVLGAGNVNSIAPMDALYKLFTERRVVIIKMNPVNEYVGPYMEAAFKALIDEGFMAVVYGGAKEGSYLCYHDEIDDVHITGSDITHDIIVWGPKGEERERRMAEGDPLLKKPISSELGNVSPVMIVPGDYKEKELAFMAENVATQLTNNGGFNCNAAKVLVTAKGWAQRDTFLAKLKSTLASIPPRKAYYPGASERHAQWTEGHDQVDRIGQGQDGTLPWALITDLDSSDESQKCFKQEAFCCILAETALPVDNAVDFLKAATTFSNDVIWGTLSCCLLIDPRSQKRPEVAQALEEAIEALRFGAVLVNHWPGIAYGFVSTPWGGYAGATIEDVQSGIGWVHNSFMLDRPQKSVIRGPLMVAPKPPWFRTHRNCHNVARRLIAFESTGSIWKVPGVALAALKG